MQCVKIWITKQGMFVTSVPKTRLVFTDRYHPLGFASVLRVFFVGVSNFRPAIWLLRSRWKRQQNILWNTGMSLSPWSYNAACFHWHTDIPLVFLSLLRVFVAALRNFWATTKHRFRVSTLVRRPRSVSFLRLMWCWTRVFTFSFCSRRWENSALSHRIQQGFWASSSLLFEEFLLFDGVADCQRHFLDSAAMLCSCISAEKC